MNAEQLQRAVGCSMMTAATWVPHIEAAMFRFGVESLDERAAFIAQCAHECGRFARLEENLNYSAQRLTEVFPRRFPDLRSATYYEHAPQKLGNYLYANRNGNGPESTGDGFRYRGRGALQVTGRQNYYATGLKTGLPLMTMPEMLAEPGPAALSAGAYWVTNDLNNVLNLHGFDALSKAINIGKWNSTTVPNGNQDRRDLFAKAKAALA